MKAISAIFIACVLSSVAVGQFVVKSATDEAFPVALIDAANAAVTEKKAADTTITYCNITDANAVSSYTDDAATWLEIGDGTGEYKAIMGAGEFTHAGDRYIVKIIVAGCQTVRFWVDTIKADPNDMATTTLGRVIPVDGNDLVGAVVTDSTAAWTAQFAGVDGIGDEMDTRLDARGVTGALMTELDGVDTKLGTPATSLAADINDVSGRVDAADADINDVSQRVDAVTVGGATVDPNDLAINYGTVASAGNNTRFTLSAAFPATAAALPSGMMIVVWDADDSKPYIGIVKSYTAGRIVSLWSQLPIVPASGDVVRVYPSIFVPPDF